MKTLNHAFRKVCAIPSKSPCKSQPPRLSGMGVDDLYKALQEGRSRKDISDIVGKARQYAKQHFASEEALWARSGCPGLEEHKAVHQAYIGQVEQIWQSSGQPLED